MSARSGRIAWHLSFWMPGLGQLYKREWGKGVLFLGASSALYDRALALYPWSAFLACARPVAPLCLTAVLAAFTALWCWAVVDAGRAADAGRAGAALSRRSRSRGLGLSASDCNRD